MKRTLLLSLFILAGINYFVPEGLFPVMIALIFFIAPLDDAAVYNASYSKILPVILLVVIGIIGGIDDRNKDFYRDIFIFSKIIVYFLGGLLLGKYLNNFASFFKYFYIIAFVSALNHILLIATHLGSIYSLDTIRFVAGYGNEIEGVIVGIIISAYFNKNLKNIIGDAGNKIMTTIIFLSFLVYFSRTLIVASVIIPIFLTGMINIRYLLSSKNVKILMVPIVMVIVFFLLSYVASLQSSGSPLERLVDKFEEAPQEVGWNAQKNATATKEEIQDHWRGYEAYQGLLKYFEGSRIQKLFGYGFNTRVDLGITMKLAGEDYNEVPILHNEYVTLLVKCGVIGLLLYLTFLYRLGFQKIRYADKDSEVYYCCQMLSALSILSLLNTYIGFGLLDPTNATSPLLLGFFYGNIQRQRFTAPFIKLQALKFTT